MSNSRTIENPGSNPEAPLPWLVTDGRICRENQTPALTVNFETLAPFRTHEAARSMGGRRQREERSSLVIGTGHRTHLALIATAPHLSRARERSGIPTTIVAAPYPDPAV